METFSGARSVSHKTNWSFSSGKNWSWFLIATNFCFLSVGLTFNHFDVVIQTRISYQNIKVSKESLDIHWNKVTSYYIFDREFRKWSSKFEHCCSCSCMDLAQNNFWNIFLIFDVFHFHVLVIFSMSKYKCFKRKSRRSFE